MATIVGAKAPSPGCSRCSYTNGIFGQSTSWHLLLAKITRCIVNDTTVIAAAYDPQFTQASGPPSKLKTADGDSARVNSG
jgi:hypothetical protein